MNISVKELVVLEYNEYGLIKTCEIICGYVSKAIF